MSIGSRIRPESSKAATRRRAESRRATSAVQRERSEWKFLIHQPRVPAPVRPRSSPDPRRTGPERVRTSSPRAPRNPPLRVTTSIIFCDRASDLPANGYGRIQSDPPSMDTAGQNRKVQRLISPNKKVGRGWISRRSAPTFSRVAVCVVCLSLMSKAERVFVAFLTPRHLQGLTLGALLAAPA